MQKGKKNQVSLNVTSGEADIFNNVMRAKETFWGWSFCSSFYVILESPWADKRTEPLLKVFKHRFKIPPSSPPLPVTL